MSEERNPPRGVRFGDEEHPISGRESEVMYDHHRERILEETGHGHLLEEEDA